MGSTGERSGEEERSSRTRKRRPLRLLMPVSQSINQSINLYSTDQHDEM